MFQYINPYISPHIILTQFTGSILEEKTKMSEERNPLNVYNHFEAIKNAVAQLETIHVYELNARQYGDADTPSLKSQVADQDKQIYEYELQLVEMQKYIEEIERANSVLLKANNTLIQTNKLLTESAESAQSVAETLSGAYSKLPKFVKKIYGVK